MRAIVIFCFSLFLLLFKANEATHAITPHLSQGYEFFTENPKQKQNHTPFHKNAHVQLQKNYSSLELTLIEETQDDDENLSRKAIISIKQAAYFCYAFIVGNVKTLKKLALPYCEHLSYTSGLKYLLLRVFRI